MALMASALTSEVVAASALRNNAFELDSSKSSFLSGRQLASARPSDVIKSANAGLSARCAVTVTSVPRSHKLRNSSRVALDQLKASSTNSKCSLPITAPCILNHYATKEPHLTHHVSSMQDTRAKRAAFWSLA